MPGRRGLGKDGAEALGPEGFLMGEMKVAGQGAAADALAVQAQQKIRPLALDAGVGVEDSGLGAR